ncbi:CLUMA_CG003850, isoform A, partial [Clunio marinus]
NSHFQLFSDSFAFVVCTECGFFREENAGATITIFSRTPYPDCNELDPLLEIIENCGIPLSRLIKVDQSNCDNKCRI